MAYQEINATLRLLIRVQWVFIAILCTVALGLGKGWHDAPADITVHVPPDLRLGAQFRVGEIPANTVYTFAYYIFQQLNRWRENGEQDYGHNIYALSAYFTAAFQQELLRDLAERGRRGELASRIRALSEAAGTGFEASRVDTLSDGSWVVWLDLEIEETVQGVIVKNPIVRYPLKVFRTDVDPERNPYGLVLAGFSGEGPQRVSLTVAQRGVKS